MSETESTETPGGIIVVAILMAILGLFSLLYGLLLAGFGGLANALGGTASLGGAQISGTLLQVFGVIQLVGAVAKFVGIYGVIKARTWAFWLVVAVFAAEVLQNVYGFVSGAGVGAVSLSILIVNVGILLYVYSKQAYFGVSLGSSGEPVPT